MNKSDIIFAVCAFLQVVLIVGLCVGRVDISIYLMLMVYIQFLVGLRQISQIREERNLPNCRIKEL